MKEEHLKTLIRCIERIKKAEVEYQEAKEEAGRCSYPEDIRESQYVQNRAFEEMVDSKRRLQTEVELIIKEITT